MEKELREMEALTRELLWVVEGLWSECRLGALSTASFNSDEQALDSGGHPVALRLRAERTGL